MNHDSPFNGPDSVIANLPAPYNKPLTVLDCVEITRLFFGTTRNSHLCISKGQYKRLTEQLHARNVMLTKRVMEQEKLIAQLREAAGKLELQLANSGDDGK